MPASTRDAYADGFNDCDVCLYHRYEVVDAAHAWKAAAADHSHTSYFGALHVRNMRAWWLGVLRKQRAIDAGWTTRHGAALADEGCYTLYVDGQPVETLADDGPEVAARGAVS